MKPEPRQGRVFERDVVTPVDRIMADLDGTYWRLSEVAKILGVGQKTLRRLVRRGETQAPSHQITRGQMQMYLYTAEDIEELRKYFRTEVDENPKG